MLLIRPVRFSSLGKRPGNEIVERSEELHGGAILGDQVLQQEELHVASEVTKKCKEICLSCERVTQRTVFLSVVPPNTLHGQVKPVLDPGMEATRAVDYHLAADTVARENHHPADRVAYGIELIQFLYRHLFHDVSASVVSRERGNHRVACQPELAQFRLVMQIYAGSGVMEFKNHATRQGFTPKKPVIAA